MLTAVGVETAHSALLLIAGVEELVAYPAFTVYTLRGTGPLVMLHDVFRYAYVCSRS
jgi:hypothetical protein